MKPTIIQCIIINLIVYFSALATDMTAKIEYLSDDPSRILLNKQDWGELGINTAAHVVGETGAPLQIKDKKYTKGLGHQANGNMIINLDGLYDWFDSEVGIQSTSPGGSVIFQVLVDGEEKFNSGLMRDIDEAKKIHLPITGAQEIELVVTDGGDGIDSDMGNWAETRLTRSASQTKSSKTQL